MPSDCILTYTKIRFSPLNAKPADINIRDIAHALSLMTRANGHFQRFYSVAQHSINCAEEARAMGGDARIQLACLLHDASEAYISDITRPVKQNLPSYMEIESKLQAVIHEAFGINPTADEQAVVKKVDDTLLYYEFSALMDERICEPAPKLYSRPDFSERGFSEAEEEFLRLFDSLINQAAQS